MESQPGDQRINSGARCDAPARSRIRPSRMVPETQEAKRADLTDRASRKRRSPARGASVPKSPGGRSETEDRCGLPAECTTSIPRQFAFERVDKCWSRLDSLVLGLLELLP